MLLERTYEAVFSDQSHGFRPQRSCHAALNHIQTPPEANLGLWLVLCLSPQEEPPVQWTQVKYGQDLPYTGGEFSRLVSKRLNK